MIAQRRNVNAVVAEDTQQQIVKLCLSRARNKKPLYRKSKWIVSKETVPGYEL